MLALSGIGHISRRLSRFARARGADDGRSDEAMRRAKDTADDGNAVAAATTGLLLLASPSPQSTTTPPLGTCSGRAASSASIGGLLIQAHEYDGWCGEELFLPTVVSVAERDADDVWATDSHASSPQAGSLSNRKRELNKIAARKCRLRRREKAQAAQKEVDELQARNTQLRLRVAELEQCKQQLLELVRTHCHIRLEDAV